MAKGKVSIEAEMPSFLLSGRCGCPQTLPEGNFSERRDVFAHPVWKEM